MRKTLTSKPKSRSRKKRNRKTSSTVSLTDTQKRNLIVDKAKADPFYFINDILGYADLVGFHDDLIDFIRGPEQKKLVLIPRFHFKTSLITIGYSIWRIINDPNIRILINNKILANSRKFLYEIRQHFEHNPRFLEYFGEWKGDKWRDDFIIVNRRTVIKKEPTVSIGATDHELTSGHYDLIINDDLAGLSDMVSQAARDSTLRFYKLMDYLGDLGTQEINIGTRWHLNDIHAYVLSKGTPAALFLRKAIQDDGTLLFKERFELSEIKRMQDDDPILFEAQMQNNPRAASSNLYTLDKLKFFDFDLFKGKAYRIGYIDPAFGRRERGEPCFFSFVIAEFKDGNLYIVEWLTNRDTPERNEQLIAAKYREHRFKQLGIESNAAQSEFIRNVRKVLTGDGLIVNIESINHNQNKDRRIESIHGAVVNHVFFRQDWQDAGGGYKESMVQLTLYPDHKYKDAPDALAGLIEISLSKPTARMRKICA